eukprot:EST44056.1 DNA repair protein [Spironucleus salmonicida]
MYRIRSEQLDPLGSNYKDYRKKKQNKQDQQLQQHKISNLFTGFLFWLNGRLDPPTTYLRQIIGLHSGLIVFQFSPKITHIIAQNLSSSTFQKYGTKYPILLPGWILESINSHEILDLQKFRYQHNTIQFQYDYNYNYEILCKPFQIDIDQTLDTLISIPEVVDIKSIQSQPDLVQTQIQYLQLSQQSALYSPVKQLSLSPNIVSISNQQLLPQFQLIEQDNLEYKQKLNAVQYLIYNRPYGQQPSKGVSQFYIFISIDNFYISSLIFDNLEKYSGFPIVVIENEKILYFNQIAAKYQIQIGQHIQSLKKLQVQINLQIISYNNQRYSLISNCFYEYIRQISAEVMPYSCFECFINISGFVSEQSIYAYMQKIQQDLQKQLSISITIGAGSNPLISYLSNKLSSSTHLNFIAQNIFYTKISSQNLDFIPLLSNIEIQKLKNENLFKLQDIQQLQIQRIQSIIGESQGKKLFQALRGFDLIFKFDPVKSDDNIRQITVFSNKIIFSLINMNQYQLMFNHCQQQIIQYSANLNITKIILFLNVKKNSTTQTQQFSQHCNQDNLLQNLQILLEQSSKKVQIQTIISFQIQVNFGLNRNNICIDNMKLNIKCNKRINFIEPIQKDSKLLSKNIINFSNINVLGKEISQLDINLQDDLVQFLGCQLAISNNLESLHNINSQFSNQMNIHILKNKLRYIK